VAIDSRARFARFWISGKFNASKVEYLNAARAQRKDFL
jgi:hypothetical protein